MSQPGARAPRVSPATYQHVARVVPHVKMPAKNGPCLTYGMPAMACFGRPRSGCRLDAGRSGVVAEVEPLGLPLARSASAVGSACAVPGRLRGVLVVSDQVRDGNEVVAVRAVSACAESAAPGVAVLAALDAEVAGLALRALVDGVDPGGLGGSGGRPAASEGGLAAGVGAPAAAAGGCEAGSALRAHAGGCRLGIVTHAGHRCVLGSRGAGGRFGCWRSFTAGLAGGTMTMDLVHVSVEKWGSNGGVAETGVMPHVECPRRCASAGPDPDALADIGQGGRHGGEVELLGLVLGEREQHRLNVGDRPGDRGGVE